MKKKIVLKEERLYQDQKLEDDFFDFRKFEKNLQINVLEKSDDKIVFEMMNIEAPIANALRRIMIAEIPTMAIHKVEVVQNTSVIPDEVLAHRLGLIPIKVDPREFIFKKEQDDHNDKNSIKFQLRVKCEADEVSVFASDMKWQPQGVQQETIQDIRPVHEQILIAKLRQNQEIWVNLICEKGIGKTHAKWSPVATAFYKLMPQITLKEQITKQRAKQLQELCPKGVFDIEDNICVVRNSLNCTTCRECIREANGFEKSIELSKVSNHFIFTIESVGMYKASEIMIEAIEILRNKAKAYQVKQ